MLVKLSHCGKEESLQGRHPELDSGGGGGGSGGGGGDFWLRDSGGVRGAFPIW